MADETIRVFYVDDDEIDRLGVERLVEQEKLPWELKTAGSKAEAEKLLAQDSDFDVVLLDYHLGDGYGLDLVAKTGDVPAIIVTGNGSEEVAAAAMEQGAYGYVIKDAARNYLKLIPGTVKNVLSRRRSELELRTLRGILPICWNCKKIRDDEGYWDEVENYLRHHSGARFSHSLCPACFEKEMDKLPPEMRQAQSVAPHN